MTKDRLTNLAGSVRNRLLEPPAKAARISTMFSLVMPSSGSSTGSLNPLMPIGSC